jgi:hypothetical protein
MKKISLLIIIVLSLYGYLEKNPDLIKSIANQSTTENSTITSAYENRKSNVQISGSGVVLRKLSDDTTGSRHQKFILKLPTGQTLLIAHNIDLAPRIDTLRKGDTVNFYGEYEWDAKGGVVHWTHRDPGGRHLNGWLKHDGVTYQ